MVGFKELPPNMQPTLGTKMISAGILISKLKYQFKMDNSENIFRLNLLSLLYLFSHNLSVA